MVIAPGISALWTLRLKHSWSEQRISIRFGSGSRRAEGAGSAGARLPRKSATRKAGVRLSADAEGEPVAFRGWCALGRSLRWSPSHTAVSIAAVAASVDPTEARNGAARAIENDEPPPRRKLVQ
jgi:hypothetical protein